MYIKNYVFALSNGQEECSEDKKFSSFWGSVYSSSFIKNMEPILYVPKAALYAIYLHYLPVLGSVPILGFFI